jgi:glycosyltransferase involved in cell wall biosynthesis
MGKLIKVKRIKLGLIFTGSLDWIGGLYYLRNITLALKTLGEYDKPSLFIFYNKSTPIEIIKNTNYPFLRFLQPQELSYIKKVMNKIIHFFTGKNPFYHSKIKKYGIDFLYPFNDYSQQYNSINSKKISWIYDFQHKILPELFNKEELEFREKEFSLITSSAHTIVVSSNDSKQHLLKFYPGTNAEVKVLPFVSIIDHNHISDFSRVQQLYEIHQPYFLVSNQFWQHKNHRVILESLKLLKENGESVLIIFTGQTRDTRNPNYFSELEHFIKDNGLEKYLKILGLIPREHQLSLMKNCIAVIQPSKFEGWGTVVEDAKTLGKPVILSDINVHREQMGEYGYFFPVDNPGKLTEFLIQFSNMDLHPKIFPGSSSDRIKTFAESFISIFKNIMHV